MEALAEVSRVVHPSRILALDPGTTRTAWVLLEDGGPTGHGIMENAEMLRVVGALSQKDNLCAIEMIASYGMSVGAEVFETCVWIGRFVERWSFYSSGPLVRVYRRDVKMHLCGSMRAKDPNIRQALIDRYGGETARGTKKSPGPLYGIKADEWAALAVAVTVYDGAGEGKG